MAFLLCHVLVNTSHFPTILPTNAPNLRKTSRYILKQINTRRSPNPLQHRGLGDLTWHEWVHCKRIHAFCRTNAANVCPYAKFFLWNLYERHPSDILFETPRKAVYSVFPCPPGPFQPGNTLLETGKTGHPVYPVRRYPRQPKSVFSRCHFPKKRRRMER